MTDDRVQQVEKLVQVIDRLRADDGCPWDREQTLETLIPCLREETAEVADAIATGDPKHIREELGDVLMNVVLMSRVTEQDGHYSLRDVAADITEKLIRRHPHVFGDRDATTPDQAKASWESAKAEEKQGDNVEQKSRLDGIPAQFSALQRAQKLASRAAKTGFDWPATKAALEKVEEELGEVRAALSADRKQQEQEFGDLLFATVCSARLAGIDCDLALRKACERFERRFRFVEAKLGERLEQSNLEQMEAVWQEAKAAGL